MKNKIKITILVLISILLVFSTYLAFSEYFGSEVCLVSTNGKSSCGIVQNSSYGKIAGIKVSYLGPISFILLLILFVLSNIRGKQKEQAYEFYLLGTIIGTTFSFYFIFIQAFILKVFCSTCIIIDIGMLIIATLSWKEYFSRKRR